MVNMIVLGGRLTADAEIKTTITGSHVCNFNMANNIKNATGGEDTTFMEVVIFGNYAKSMHPYLKKGIFINVVGKLKQEDWIGKDGKNMRKDKIYAKEIHFNTPKGSSTQDIPPQEAQENYEEFYNSNFEGEGYEGN